MKKDANQKNTGITTAIDPSVIELVKKDRSSSFAVWNPENAGDLSVFENETEFAKKIKPNIILLGMNMGNDAKKVAQPFANFHSSEPNHND